MRKLFSYVMLMAAGLLISGNAWGAAGQGHSEPQAGDVAKVSVDVAGVITTTYYATLQDAFDDLPNNSYPVTLQMLDNALVTVQKGFEISKYSNVTLDLNGKMISANSTVASGSQVLLNNGTLTITDESGTGEGVITSSAEKPDAHEDDPYPTYASNTITNNGTIYMNAGLVFNAGEEPGAAQYAIDNKGDLIMNGGTLQGRVPVRMVCNQNKTVRVEINSGEINARGSLALWAQIYNGGVADVIVNDGTLKSNGNSIKLQDYGIAGTARAKLHINGGTLYGDCAIEATTEDCEITAGTFMQGTLKCSEEYPHNQIMTGGIFIGVSKTETPVYEYLGYWNQNETTGKTKDDFITNFTSSGNVYESNGKWVLNFGTGSQNFWENDLLTTSAYPNLMKEDVLNKIESGEWSVIDAHEYSSDFSVGIYWFLVKQTGTTPSDYQKLWDNIDEYIATGFSAQKYGNSDDDIIILPTTSKNIVVETDDEHTITWTGNATEPEQTNPQTTDVVNITNNDASNNVTLEINGDVDVYQINVNGNHNYTPGEAQIVVKDGATLNVGNGGIVSENDVLTTVLVESGGTLIVGTNGIDKEGDATPIEIQASEEKGTGTLIFSPNSKEEDTKKYAEVNLYTYCKKVGDKYYWQQFAIPVTGLTNDNVVKTNNTTSYVFEWDYATYGWSQLSDWSQLDEPFAGYDMTNVSQDGGVVYTFKGDLIGNQNIQLTLPHSDYCVMGNSYTAPISIDALFEQINKEMAQGTIERTVYKYDAKAGYYVYTNELEQALSKLGIMNAAFTDIKPMEGFLLNLQNGNTAGVMLNYANAVFKPATTSASSAPARTASTTDLTIAKIMVKSDNYTDAMTLIEGEEFSSDIENGKDAYKYINQEGINLYAFSNNDKLAMVASDDIEGTNIAFQSSNDVNYTLTFSNVINSDYELLDMQTNIRTPMVEGASYSFTAAPNTLNPARFMVVTPMPAMPTDAEQVKESNNVKGVYTILGQYLCEAENWSELPKGVYIVNGVKIVK